MNRIHREDQVSDDPDGRREWEPTGFTGWLAETFGGDPEPVRVTASEARLLDDLGPFGLQALVSARDDARAEANKRFPSQAPPPQGNDDHNDAFRHAYWNALMTRNIGEDFAHDYGYAHEPVPLNPSKREAMDLYNNTVGQRIAADNPFASEEGWSMAEVEASVPIAFHLPGIPPLVAPGLETLIQENDLTIYHPVEPTDW